MVEFSFVDQLFLIFGMALVTYIPRMAPLLLLSSRELNPFFMRWLEMVPPAVLAALLGPEIILRPGTGGAKNLFVSPENVFLPAAAATFFIGWLTKSFFASIAAGMGTVAAIRYCT